jgi:hypothetical protein
MRTSLRFATPPLVPCASGDALLPEGVRLRRARGDTGGLISLRGLYYQYLYSIRLMRLLLNDEITHFSAETVDDFVAWFQDPGGTISRLIIVQVKTRLDKCFLTDLGAVGNVGLRFAQTLNRLSVPAETDIELRLVVNPHPDCDDSRCLSPASEALMIAVSDGSVSGIAWERTPVVTVEHFLPLPLRRHELLEELRFLASHAPGLHRFLESQEAVATLTQAILGLVLPLHTDARERDGGLSRDGVRLLENRAFDRARTRQNLEAAIGAAVSRADRFTRRQRAATAVDGARIRARSQLSVSLPAAHVEPSFGIDFRMPADAEDALTAIHLLSNTERPLAWDPNSVRVSFEPGGVRLEQRLGSMIPVYEYLRQCGTHRDRILLIASLLRTLESWARDSVALRSFRAMSPRFRDLYLVDIKDGAVDLRIADVAVLDLSPDTDGFLNAQWMRGAAVAKALRQLYYGCSSAQRVMRTKLYRAPWNDNIVADIASWLYPQLPDVADACRQLSKTLVSPLMKRPLFINDADSDFVRNALDVGVIGIAEGLQQCSPKTIVGDRITRGRTLIFLSGDTCQIGVTVNSDGSVVARKFNAYQTRRWASPKVRDLALGVPFDEPRRDGTLVWASRADVSVIAKQYFGLTEEQYSTWFEERIRSAASRAGGPQLIPALTREWSFLNRQRARLDYLRGGEFGYDKIEDLPDAGSELLRLPDARGLEKHLKAAGYDLRELPELTAWCRSVTGRRLAAHILDVEQSAPDLKLSITLKKKDADLATQAVVNFADEGTDRTLSGDEVPFRVVLASTASPHSDREAAHVAVDFLERTLGTEGPGLRPHEGSWRGALRWPTSATEVSNPRAVAAQVLRDLATNSTELAIITGAAGTGKTTVTAWLAAIHTDATEKDLRDIRRVLVVAATHFALDNFMGVFRTITQDKNVPYRYIVPARVQSLKREGRLNADLYDWSNENYSSVTHTIRKLTSTFRGDSGLADCRGRLARLVQYVRQHRPAATLRHVVIAEHEAWRSAHDRRVTWLKPWEVEQIETLVDEKLQALSSPEPATAPASEADTQVQREPYACFAARLVVTTLDAVDDLPDTAYDLVIFEEASQLRLAKLLKVLTKVARSNGGTIPPLVLSGDSRQLPPFVDVTDIVDASPSETGSEPLRMKYKTAAERRDVLDHETTFEMLIRRNVDRVTVLQHQGRMSRRVAALLNSLFYADQDWKLVRDYEEGQVVWIDTSNRQPRVESDGPSLFNRVEVDIVTSLVKRLDPKASILIISPYFAHVKRLGDLIKAHRLHGNVNVRTIDGCQGIQADIVVVSFVTLAFGHGSDFVAEPRRMNVALSRAKRSLYLVGDLSQLERSVDETSGYKHMEGLLALSKNNSIVTRQSATPGL